MNGTKLGTAKSARGAFTLVELLTVVAIIALLIGILIPSMRGARDQAKNLGTKTMIRGISDGLEAFRNDHGDQFPITGGFPPSRVAEDQASSGEQDLYGAQWLVRYLMGKDLKGYVPRENVPSDVLARGQGSSDYQQQGWYDFYAPDDPDNVQLGVIRRDGPYVNRDAVEVAQLAELEGQPQGQPPDEMTLRQYVFVDAFGRPVLYYAANSVLARRANAPIAGMGRPGDDPGIFNFYDNALFTGLCTSPGGVCGQLAGWYFPGTDSGMKGHKIKGFWPVDDYENTDVDDFVQPSDSFAYYILNKEVFRKSLNDPDNPSRGTIQPYNKDSFLLITAGKDGVYGTNDDVNNF